LITTVSIFLPFFKIIAPGAVVVAGNADKQQMGKIAIAGPATNLLLSGALVASASSLLAASAQINFILLIGGFFNAWLALFNLIPFSVLDGLKIFNWNKKLWILAFAISITMTATAYWLMPV
jgi:Zn-dependent protease